MKIYKTMVFFEQDTTGTIHQCDTIEYQGKFWLVPQWLEFPAEQVTKPLRIICVETLPHQKTLGSPFGDFALNAPISRAVFEGQIQPPPGSPYVVIERPDIPLKSPGKLQ